MVPAAGDKVVSGKKGLDAFPGTDLEQILKDNGIETVALSGFLTNCCVESSMRTAYEKGFNTVARRRRPSRVAAAPRPICRSARADDRDAATATPRLAAAPPRSRGSTTSIPWRRHRDPAATPRKKRLRFR